MALWGPRIPNPELNQEVALAHSTPEEFAQLEAQKALGHGSRKQRPLFAKLLRMRGAGLADAAPQSDGEALHDMA